MDLSYTTIPTCEGTFVTLHREPALKYHVEDPKDPMNKLACYDDELGNFAILANSLAPYEEIVKSEETMVFGRCTLTELNLEWVLKLGLYSHPPWEKLYHSHTGLRSIAQITLQSMRLCV